MRTHPRTRAALAVLTATAFAACGGASFEGAYTGQGDAIFDSLTFLPDGRAQVVLIGVTHEGSYETSGDTLTLTAPGGDQTRLVLDGNCLSNSLAGVYCRSGAAPSAAPAAAASVGNGEVYEATTDEGVIGLELRPAGQARLTMTPFGGGPADRMTIEVYYEASGDGVTVSMPGDDPMRLTRAGRDLVATMDGETARFVRK